MTDKDKLEKLKKLADAMYYAAKYLTTDASRLHKAMDEYHKFVILEYHNRKEDSVNNGLDLGCGVIWKDIEPVSEDLENAAYQYANCFPRKFDMASMAFIKGANWQKEQMEAYRIKHCKSLTNEQAELEENFVSSHVEKNNRIPTFLDAIEYGIEYGKQQMMKEAFVYEKKHDTAMILASECLRNHGWFGRERDFNNLWRFICGVKKLFSGEFRDTDKVLLIRIKED